MKTYSFDSCAKKKPGYSGLGQRTRGRVAGAWPHLRATDRDVEFPLQYVELVVQTSGNKKE
jgi:hypothetical protein